jgi:DNA-binding PadR family transcriptional regulator
MKIMAIICHNYETGLDSYGYTIWQSLKDVFHIYLNDCDVRNVYHHLKDLCELEFIERLEGAEDDPNQRCLYRITEMGLGLERRYIPYLKVMNRTVKIR